MIAANGLDRLLRIKFLREKNMGGAQWRRSESTPLEQADLEKDVSYPDFLRPDAVHEKTVPLVEAIGISLLDWHLEMFVVL